MLAGRKLLLADDSVTIQKVIDLTFADEGVRVVTFSNGQAAIDNLEQVAPDIVLADVFMPEKTGYEVCEYVKNNEKLKHIPVMLLVGSFEPFDEAEARRVGADDILTKPFQSIRRLIDRVGSLVGNQPTEKEVPTAELPKKEVPHEEKSRLGTKELELTTADTLQLSNDAHHSQPTTELPEVVAKPLTDKPMETSTSEPLSESTVEADALLDLGEFEPRSVSDEEFGLDLEMEDAYSNFVSQSAPASRSFVEPAITETASVALQPPHYQSQAEYVPYATEVPAFEHPVTRSSAPMPPLSFDQPSEVSAAPVSNTGSLGVSADNLSPAMIDAIARRVVQLMSDEVVREVAWEVVPQLAELMIKRQLEESQPK